MKRRQRRPVLDLNKTQTSSHGEHVQNKCKQISSDYSGQNVPANPLANLLCHYNSDSDTEDSKKDVRKLDDQVNNFLKEIQLIAPTESISNDSSNPALPTNSAVQSTHPVNQQALLWRECLDESSGYPYYWHIETNEVTWEMPDELKFYKNNAKTSSVVRTPGVQDPHWVNFSSIAYQQSHENIPEGMIPREVVARNRNRYIRNETVKKSDSQSEQENANTSDAMDDDSDDGKIEMITSFGSDESDSDTGENNHSSNETSSVPTSESTNIISTTKSKNLEMLPAPAPLTLPRLPISSETVDKEYPIRNLTNDTKTEVLDVKFSEETDVKYKKSQAFPQRNVDDETEKITGKTNEENLAKKDTKHNAEPDLDFRISLVPGYDEDSDVEDETETKVERKALFPIPQSEDATESTSSTHRSLSIQSKTILDDSRMDGESDINVGIMDKKIVEAQEDEGIVEKAESIEDSNAKTEEDTQKNKFLDSLRGRSKCFQRKKRIAFDVPSAKVKTNDESETNKVEAEASQTEVVTQNDTEHDTESQKESRVDMQKESTEDTVESEKSNLPVESSTIEEETNSQCETPTDSKEDEEEVNLLTQIILEKLKFLSEGKQSVSPVQMMAIQLQTLFVAWEEGYLEKTYLRKWLTDTSHELERLEQDAAPPGWLCQWDRSHKRYYYQNATTGVTQWTYPDTGIAGGTEEMEICSTPPPADQEDIITPVEAEKAKVEPKKAKEDDTELSKETKEPRPSDIEAPPPPQISNPSPPPPPRIFAEDLKKDKRKRDKCTDKIMNKKKRPGEEITTIPDAKLLETSSGPSQPPSVSPQLTVLPITTAEPLPPGVDLTEAPYEIPATALKRIIYSAVQPQGNALYEATARDPTVPILGHPAIVQEHYLQYPAYQHLHAQPAALVLPHKHGVQPAIQLIPDYTPLYSNHKVIEKPPVKTAKESLVSALDSFYSDIARIENSGTEQTVPRPDISTPEILPTPVEEVKVEMEQEPVPTESTVKEKKRKKARIGISKKHKEVSSMVAKWQKAQQNFEDNT